MNKETVTVGELIDSLKEFDRNAPVQIMVHQANQRYPVAYVNPSTCNYANIGDENRYAQRIDGHHVRIEIMLPNDDKTMMITQIRKIK